MFFRFAIFVGLGSVVATIIYLTPIPEQTFLSCDRPCHHLDWPMICRVKLTLEPFHTLSKACGNCPANKTACLAKYCVSADGHHRGILTANRQLPGPSIQIFLSGVDVANGIFGSLIVRQADAREPHRLLYDVDDPNHVVMVSQWHHSIVTDTLAGQANKKPALLLINGKGHQPNGPQVPLASFNVTRGLRYRFRLAHAGGAGACPITFAVEEHPLTLIALDGNPVVPLKVKSISLAKGERADFILSADKHASSKDVYSVNVHTDKGCHATVIGSALLKYQGVISIDDSSPVNPLDKQDHLVEMTTNPSDKCNSPGNEIWR
ncbi:hypothetical protein G9C98_004606 [Cotesia typhae]|uniref:Plastocyanin-like domain-containing protein n=1 Tax=Cotesia typhae TaxID=2053667 RepID=A0A8J5QUG3_9HYME|nr:hypothetical protein G9C98_004606 [Cotesia typhae]